VRTQFGGSIRGLLDLNELINIQGLI
jgi:hypothetical protein